MKDYGSPLTGFKPEPSVQTMINSSIAVMTKPSVSTFEAHERDSLQWALIYTAIGAAISGLLLGIGALISGGSLVATLVGGIIGSFIGLLVYAALVFFIGRAFGGTGKFGEVAYDIALFSAPLTAINGVLGLIPILGALVSLVLVVYNLYLSYLAIQSGMNLPKDKALYTILIILAIGLVIGCGFAVLIGGIIAATMQTAP